VVFPGTLRTFLRRRASRGPARVRRGDGELGNYYHNSYGAGKREVLSALRAEEANLLQARRLALENGWWRGVISAMQGLDELYDHTGRRAEWKRLVEEVVPAFVEPKTEAPLPGLEEEWSLVIQYRVGLAREERNLPRRNAFRTAGRLGSAAGGTAPYPTSRGPRLRAEEPGSDLCSGRARYR